MAKYLNEQYFDKTKHIKKNIENDMNNVSKDDKNVHTIEFAYHCMAYNNYEECDRKLLRQFFTKINHVIDKLDEICYVVDKRMYMNHTSFKGSEDVETLRFGNIEYTEDVAKLFDVRTMKLKDGYACRGFLFCIEIDVVGGNHSNEDIPFASFMKCISKCADVFKRSLLKLYLGYGESYDTHFVIYKNDDEKVSVLHPFTSQIDGQTSYMCLYDIDSYDDIDVPMKECNYCTPVKVDISSRINNGDILYFSTIEGKLGICTYDKLDEHLYPLAICVKANYKYVDLESKDTIKHSLFASLLYANDASPKQGSATPIPMKFRFYNIDISLDPTWYGNIVYSGIFLTNRALGEYNYHNKGMIDANIQTSSDMEGVSSPVFESVYKFSPLGTHEGNWFLPNSNELYDLFTGRDVNGKYYSSIRESLMNEGYDKKPRSAYASSYTTPDMKTQYGRFIAQSCNVEHSGRNEYDSFVIPFIMIDGIKKKQRKQ